MLVTPKQQYEKDLLDPSFHEDPSQKDANNSLNSLYYQLIKEDKRRQSWLSFFRRKKCIKGCYLWGGVGTGKSYLMDTFYHCLPIKTKMRIHFHEFMRKIQRELVAHQGKKNPLQVIAREWARKISIICFDEFFVKDIADAMILGRCLQRFYEEGVAMVATSNVEPSDLYKNGLQRERFMPAIKLLQENMNVMHVDNYLDYRRQYLKPAGVYFHPLNPDSEQSMMQSFHYYAKENIACHDPMMINGRKIDTVRTSRRVAWFDFADLCATARSSEDYLDIAQQYPLIMLSNIVLNEHTKRDVVVRFVNLIDVLYDQHRLVIISATADSDQFYTGHHCSFEFERTKSRLLEMSHNPYIEDCNIEIK